MRSILVLYMTGVLCMDKSEAVEVSHLFNACIYVLPLLGAWIADQFLGRYKTILYVSLLYCLGHGVLATADLTDSTEIRQRILFCGLFIIALGAGGIKPSVSSFVGDQVDEKEKVAMTRIYAAFYWSINLGSFFSFLVIPWVRQSLGYGWAFGVPGIFMALATFIFWSGRKQYRHREPAQPQFLPALFCRVFKGATEACKRFGGQTVAAATTTTVKIAAFIVIAPIVIILALQAREGAERLAALSGIGELGSSLCGMLALLLYAAAFLLAALKLASTFRVNNFFGIVGCMLYENKASLCELYPAEQRKAARNMLRVLTVFLLIVPFWSLYDQTMSSWVLQGDKMQAVHLPGGLSFGAEEMQSMNPMYVMILVPTVTLLLYPRLGKWAAPLKRMGAGIVIAGLSYGSVAWLQMRLDAGEQLCILWQAIPYAILTVAEILVSTTGLEYAYTAAGKNLKSTVASFWYLTSTLGNTLVFYLTTLVDDPASTSTFLLYGAMSVIVGLVFILITTRRAFQAEE